MANSSSKSSSTLIRTVITAINGCLSSLGAYKDFPIGTIRGLDKASIIVAFVGAAVGTLIAVKPTRHELRVTILFGISVVFAVFYYEKILSSGGVEQFQMLLALICYFDVFAALFYLATLLARDVFGF